MFSLLTDVICYMQNAVVETIPKGIESDEDVQDAIERLCASIYEALCAIRTPTHETGTFAEKCDKLLRKMTDEQLLAAADVIADVTGYSPFE